MLSRHQFQNRKFTQLEAPMRSALALFILSLAAAPLTAQGTSAVCKDGSPSASSGRGACSGHGGVDAKATASANAKAAKAEKKAEAATAKAEKKTAAAAAKMEKKTAEAAARVEKKADVAPAKAEKKAEVATEKATKATAKADKANDAAAATSVKCTDGSMSAGGRGACSGHGGIAKSNPVEKKAEVAEKKADAAKATAKVATATAEASRRGEDNDPKGAIAKCKDGMYSHAANRRGACSRHQGVASWM
jgi:ATPase subunit of ABC transporter with duplicated ATPase domains